MKERNLWKMASAVFVISMAFVLAGGGVSVKANDRDGVKSFGYGYRNGEKSFDHHDGDIGNLFVTADTVVGHVPPPTSCTLSNRFEVGQAIIFRIRVVDDNDHYLNAEKLSEVYVRILDTGEEINAVYGTHPPDGATDAYWTATYPIPEGRSGSFSYEVVAIAPRHRVGTFRPFDVDASLLTIVEP